MEKQQRTSIRLMFFIVISLTFSILLSFQNISQSKKTIVSKAADTQCPEPTGNEQYENKILPVGSHLAANNNPVNYKQIRQLYNCQNKNNSEVAKKYIPVVVVYDLFFLKGSQKGIENNLKELKKYGLFPIIRVASYTTGGNTWIKLYPPTDAKIMGQNLALALKSVVNFPELPIVVFFNEVNLHDEWGGTSNPEEFSESFNTFAESMGEGNFRLYFPALSYGWSTQIGISPQEFLQRFFASKKFTKKLNGVDLNIYGTDFSDIKAQYNNQKIAFDSYATYFQSPAETVIGELGPVRDGSAIYDCSMNGSWAQVATQIVNDYLKNPLAIATMGCFGNNTVPVIAHYDSTQSQLVSLQTYGQIQNTENISIQQTTNNQPTNNQSIDSGAFTYSFQGTNLSVTYSNAKGLTWVNLAGSGPTGKINMAGTTPTMGKNTNGFYWTYIIKDAKEGTYTFIFSDNCQKYNKAGMKKEELKDVCDKKGTDTIVIQKNNKQELSTSGKTQTQQNLAKESVTQNTQQQTQQQPQGGQTGQQYKLQGRIGFWPGRVMVEFTEEDLKMLMPQTAELCYVIVNGKAQGCRRAGSFDGRTLVIEYDVNNPPMGIQMDLTPAYRYNPGHLAWIPIP